MTGKFRRSIVAGVAVAAVGLAGSVLPASARGKPPAPSPTPTSSPSQQAAGSFVYGQLQATAVGSPGCGTNNDGEPTVHVAGDNTLFGGSERGIGGGSDAWRQLSAVGGPGASACAPQYRGQPNAVAGVGASGGDIDSAWGSAPLATGAYPLYVASLNLGSVSVSHSTDRGTTFSNTPVQAGLPIDDREWIAAYGSSTSLLTYHDITTNNIDVLRSDNVGTTYAQVSQAIPAVDYKAMNNQLGNIVIDHRNTAGATGGQFWAYQSFVAPSSSSGNSYNEAFLAVSNDGGSTWTDRSIPCSVSSKSVDHNFPNVSVAPNGTVWYAWSDDSNVYTASSTDHGSTWTCSSRVSTATAQAIYPWLVATSNGVDLVYYGSTTAAGKGQIWYVYFAQNLASTPSGWGSPQQLMPVHQGSVCEGGISCSGGRQLLDDFGVDTDQSGWAHIIYSHDQPDLGGSGTYTGYAVQTSGTAIGYPN